VALAAAPAGRAAVAEEPWPPRETSTPVFVHVGEDRSDASDSAAILPKIVAEAARYRPALVALSGDKAANGTHAALGTWRSFMDAFDRAGIAYFPAIGNTDRRSPPGIRPGLQGLGPLPVPSSSAQPYRDVFAARPFPFGDGRPYGDTELARATRPAADPPGASTHYVVDHGAVRWIFLDNSCWSIVRCDPVQNPPFPDAEGNRGQLEWLERRATEGSRAGRTVFVVMHMPTRDPRDQTHSDPEAQTHVMGKRESFADNARFEEVAERTGVDGVFVAHIRAQVLYRGRGRVPYYVDGGAGGELHTVGPVGTDHGYWLGYRLVRVSRGRVITDAVPIFVDGGITLRGAEVVRRGRLERYQAFGRQPIMNDSAKVETLELRDPRPATRPASAAPAEVPTRTAAESLPAPARMFTSSNPFVLGPKAPAADDPRRDPLTQTKNGLFRARCPGRARVRVTSGFETTVKGVRVPSRAGRIVRSVRLTMRRRLRLRLRPRLAHRVASVRLAQPAEVLVRVRRRGRTVRTLEHVCARAGRLTVVWDGRVRRRGRLVRNGRYRLEALVRSDRRTVRRARTVRVGRGRGG
jgi:hypothetical protein